jgi:hypothetical protein
MGHVNPQRRYRQTATTITSAGKQKTTKANRAGNKRASPLH